MKLVTVVGARPQFIKAAAVSRALSGGESGIREVLVHTGQHYDEKMSKIFFDQLGIGTPDYNLGISGGTHGEMTGRMLQSIESVLVVERPDWVLIYGDTNSTLAAALAASKLRIPVAHVEAGLRSFNMKMPEEVNRIVADRLSAMLFCPTEAAVRNLRGEGATAALFLVGDVMYDSALHFAALSDERSTILQELALQPKAYVLATCHRAENTDEVANLEQILQGLSLIAESMKVVLPLHPRTRNMIGKSGLTDLADRLEIVEPVSYLDMIALEKNAAFIVTDSGGVQKEAFFFSVPCITMREETEWTETVDIGWNILTGPDAAKIRAAFDGHSDIAKVGARPYGTGDAASLIRDALLGQG